MRFGTQCRDTITHISLQRVLRCHFDSNYLQSLWEQALFRHHENNNCRHEKQGQILLFEQQELAEQLVFGLGLDFAVARRPQLGE